MTALEYQTLNVTSQNAVAQILFSHPPANILTTQAVDELSAAFHDLEKDTSLRAVVIGSALEKIFISGADINQFVAWDTEDKGLAGTKPGAELFRRIELFPVPVICAVSGAAFGGGLELALCCDFRVFSTKAKVGLPESGLGIVPGYGGTQRLPRLVGHAMAKYMMFTGTPVGGDEAYRIGLAEVLTQPEECLTTAMKLAQTIAGKAPLAISGEKRCVAFGMEHSMEEGLAYELAEVGRLCASKDKLEGAVAFLEKRAPLFKNH